MDLTTIISTVFGGVSAATGVAGLLLQSRRSSRFRALPRLVKTLPEAKRRKVREENRALIELLEGSGPILEHLRHRVLHRYLAGIAAAIGAAATVPIDGPGQLGAEEAMEWWDLISLFGTAALAPALYKGLLLKEDDRKFLQCFDSVLARFDRLYVRPAMRQFVDTASKMRTVKDDWGADGIAVPRPARRRQEG